MCFFTVFHRCHPLLSHRYLAYSSKGSEIIAYSPIMASVVKNAAYSVHPAICFDAWLTIGNICETSLSLLRCLVDQYQIVNLLVDAFVFACTSETGNIIFTRPVQVDSNKITALVQPPIPTVPLPQPFPFTSQPEILGVPSSSVDSAFQSSLSSISYRPPRPSHPLLAHPPPTFSSSLFTPFTHTSFSPHHLYYPLPSRIIPSPTPIQQTYIYQTFFSILTYVFFIIIQSPPLPKQLSDQLPLWIHLFEHTHCSYMLTQFIEILNILKSNLLVKHVSNLSFFSPSLPSFLFYSLPPSSSITFISLLLLLLYELLFLQCLSTAAGISALIRSSEILQKEQKSNIPTYTLAIDIACTVQTAQIVSDEDMVCVILYRIYLYLSISLYHSIYISCTYLYLYISVYIYVYIYISL